ncbi:PREDICTED: uncharacterized protein LOC102029814 [Chinchilla lanigera]|uniref:uncharacterized protein LOC102029814 n=1 Tax=Chinchilla lanigera TaxID=34839 RepID=UPI000695AD18|nr:PREDICTED: uncharacterized protein LOC102029814 [Chinchilla lanigera]
MLLGKRKNRGARKANVAGGRSSGDQPRRLQSAVRANGRRTRPRVRHQSLFSSFFAIPPSHFRARKPLHTCGVPTWTTPTGPSPTRARTAQHRTPGDLTYFKAARLRVSSRPSRRHAQWAEPGRETGPRPPLICCCSGLPPTGAQRWLLIGCGRRGRTRPHGEGGPAGNSPASAGSRGVVATAVERQRDGGAAQGDAAAGERGRGRLRAFLPGHAGEAGHHGAPVRPRRLLHGARRGRAAGGPRGVQDAGRDQVPGAGRSEDSAERCAQQNEL